MPEMDKVSVALEVDSSRYTGPMARAAKQATDFARAVDRSGQQANKTAAQFQSAFTRISAGFSKVRQDAARGAEFKLKVDDSALSSIAGKVAGARQQAQEGATFRVEGDTSGLVGAATQVDALKANVNEGATLRVGADTSGLATASSEMAAVRADAANGATMNVTANFDGAGAMAAMAGYNAAVGESDSRSRSFSSSVQSIGSAMGFLATPVAAAAAALNVFETAGEGGATVASALDTMLARIGAGAALLAAPLAAAAAATVPLLGGLSAVGAMGVGAAGGFGLIGAAAFGLAQDLTKLSDAHTKAEDASTNLEAAETMLQTALASGDEDAIAAAREKVANATKALAFAEAAATNEAAAHGDAINGLYSAYESFKETAGTAFQPAEDSLARLSTSLLEMAEGALPALGNTASSTMGEFAGAIQNTIDTFNQPVEQNSIAAIMDSMPDIVGNLTRGAGDLGAALVNIFGAAAPYAVTLSETIAGILENFRLWTESAEGQTAITEAIEMAVPVFQSLWDAAVGIGGALLRFSEEAGGDLPALIDTLATGIIGLVDGFTRLYDGAGFAAEVLMGIANSVDTFIAALPEESWLDKVTGVGEGDPSILPNLQAMWSEADGYLANLAPSVTLLDILLGNNSMSDADGGIVWLLAKLGEFWTASGEWLAGLSPEISLIDVIMGNASADDAETGLASLLPGLQTAWEGISEWLTGLVPEVTLMDVIMGNASADEAETGLASLLPGLQAAWEGISEWLTSLVPEVTLMDVIMGNASADEAETGLASLLPGLQSAWEGISEWLSSLVPEVTLMDVIMGNANAEDAETGIASLLPGLQAAWESIQEWLSGLVPETSLLAVITGASTAEEGAEAGGLAALPSLLDGWLSAAGETFNTWYEYYKTAASDFLVSLYNDYWLYYFGSDGVIATSVGEGLQYLYDTYWMPYFGTDGSFTTAISDFMSYLYNDWFLYYLGSDGLIATAVSDGLTYLYDTYWYPYFGDSGTFLTAISDFMNYLYNDWFLYYLGSDGLVATAVSDGLQYLYDNYWAPYFGEDGSLLTMIGDFFSYLYNDWFLYYLGPDGTVVTAAQDAWDAMQSGVESFTGWLYDNLPQGVKDAVDSALGWLQTLADGLDKILGALNLPTLGLSISSEGQPAPSGMAEGGILAGADLYARGGTRKQSATGGVASGRTPHAVYGEAGKPESYTVWGRKDNLPYAQGYLQSVGYTAVPAMAAGGILGAGHPGYSGEGLGPEHWDYAPAIQSLVDDVTSQWSVGHNTYVGHGNPGGATEDMTVDFWGGARGTAIDWATGEQIKDHVLSNYSGSLAYMIWGGNYYDGSGSVTPWPDDPHNDHVHVSLGAGGMGSGGIMGLLTKAKGMFDTMVGELGTPDLGDGPVYDPIEGYLTEMPGKAWDWLKSKLPSVSGALISGAEALGLDGHNVQIGEKLAEMAGWTGSQWEALKELWARESGWDHTAQNPSGAFGIAQGMVPVHGDVGTTPAEQIEWGINYIAQQYGDPLAALAHHDAMNWYAEGGTTGTIPAEDGSMVPTSFYGANDPYGPGDDLEGVSTGITAQMIVNLGPELAAQVGGVLYDHNVLPEAPEGYVWASDWTLSPREGMTGGTEPTGEYKTVDDSWTQQMGSVGTELTMDELQMLDEASRAVVEEALGTAGLIEELSGGEEPYLTTPSEMAPTSAPVEETAPTTPAAPSGGGTPSMAPTSPGSPTTPTQDGDATGGGNAALSITYGSQSQYSSLIDAAAGVWTSAGASVTPSDSPEWTFFDQYANGNAAETNSDGTIYLDPETFGYMDQGDSMTVVVHEFGHALGFDHNDENSIMNTAINYELDGALTEWDMANLLGGGVAPDPAWDQSPGVNPGAGVPTAPGGGTGGGNTATNSSRNTKVIEHHFNKNTGNVQNANRYHEGGLVPGNEEGLAILEPGERVLPKSLTGGFDRVADALSSRRAQPRGGGVYEVDHTEDILESIEQAIREGNENPTPVDINNPDSLSPAMVAAGLAAQASEAGKTIQGENLKKAVDIFNNMNGKRN